MTTTAIINRGLRPVSAQYFCAVMSESTTMSFSITNLLLDQRLRVAQLARHGPHNFHQVAGTHAWQRPLPSQYNKHVHKDTVVGATSFRGRQLWSKRKEFGQTKINTSPRMSKQGDVKSALHRRKVRERIMRGTTHNGSCQPQLYCVLVTTKSLF